MATMAAKNAHKLAIDAWEPKKPLFVRMFAHVVAMSAPMFHELCELARKGENIEGSRDLPAIHDWLRSRIVASSLESLLSAAVLRRATEGGRGDWRSFEPSQILLAPIMAPYLKAPEPYILTVDRLLRLSA